MAMYPAADVPVVQLSMPSLDPEALLALGARLRALRDEGVLVMGSGFMTHTFAGLRDPGVVGHTLAFDEWAADALSRGDVDALLDYRAKGPSVAAPPPPPAHYVPLLPPPGPPPAPATATAPIPGRIWLGNSIRSIQVA